MKYFGTFYVILLTICSSCSNSNWPKSKQNEFLEVCFNEGGSKDYCNCYLTEMMNYCPIAEEVEQIDFETKVEIAENCEYSN